MLPIKNPNNLLKFVKKILLRKTVNNLATSSPPRRNHKLHGNYCTIQMHQIPIFMSRFCLSHSFIYLLYFCLNWDRS